LYYVLPRLPNRSIRKLTPIEAHKKKLGKEN
jgi:hypothetical protein